MCCSRDVVFNNQNNSAFLIMSTTDHDRSEWVRAILGRPDALKLADGLDSFVFYYRRIDPKAENFVLSATLEVADASGADYQTGYGLMLVDTIACPSPDNHSRNNALLGRFRSIEGLNYSLGLRVVGGYTDADATSQQGKRHLDPSRLFSTQCPVDEIRNGDRHQFRLAKTDDGLEASLITDAGTESIRFPGCDFLLKQDQEYIYVGFAIAGDIRLNITDICFETSPGKLSHTPEGAIGHYVPDYPFSRNRFNGIERLASQSFQTVRITPDDNPGKLTAVLLGANPGCEIILADGVYGGGPYYIPETCSGTQQLPVVIRAEHPGKAVLDGSDIDSRLPLMVLRADYWILEGLVFRDAPSSGLMVCGSHNIVRQCEAYRNGDSGILMCAFPGSPRVDWPSSNTIDRCVSHDNYDSAQKNADGFGAKLSVGEGNVFYSCKAYHNIDDGFDLYTKDIIGPISPVRFTDCEAWNNGWLSGEVIPESVKRSGSGFKLGGENLAVAHVLENCRAHHNARKGFDNNTNPAPVLKGCREWDNLLKDNRRHSIFLTSLLRPFVWVSSWLRRTFR